MSPAVILVTYLTYKYQKHGNRLCHVFFHCMLSEFEPVTSLSVLAKSLGVTSAQLHFLLEEHFAGHSSLLWHSAPMHRARVSLSGCVIFQSCCSAWFQNVLAMEKASKIVFYMLRCPMSNYVYITICYIFFELWKCAGVIHDF